MTLVLLVAVELAGSVFQLLMVAYPHNYFWPKLGPEVENNMFKIPILFIYVLIYSFYPFHGGGGGGGGVCVCVCVWGGGGGGGGGGRDP